MAFEYVGGEIVLIINTEGSIVGGLILKCLTLV